MEQVLSINELQLGAVHPDTAGSLNNLATFYYDQRKYTEAEPLYERALAISERALGQDHPQTRTIRQNYARLLQRMKRDAP